VPLAPGEREWQKLCQFYQHVKTQSRISGHVDTEFCLFTDILLESLSMWGTSCQIPTCGSLFGRIGSCRIQYWSYAKIIFPAGFAGQGVLNKHPTVWLDDRLPPISQHGDTEFCSFTEIL
jgi:hypothetical protein